MIAHGRFEGNLRLQVPGKVVGESGRSVCTCLKSFNFFDLASRKENFQKIIASMDYNK